MPETLSPACVGHDVPVPGDSQRSGQGGRAGERAGLGSLPGQSGSRERERAAGSGHRPDRAGQAGRGRAGRGGAGPAGRKGEAERPEVALSELGCSRLAPNATMGLETEKADVQLFMDDDSYSRHSCVDYADPEKFADSGPDRDPNQLNSNLKVKPAVGQIPGQRVVQTPARPGDAVCPLYPCPNPNPNPKPHPRSLVSLAESRSRNLPAEGRL